MIFAPPVTPKRRGLGLGISFGIHATAFIVLLGVPALRLPRPAESPSEFKQKIEGHEARIVWYKLRKELPEVTPPKARPENAPLRAEKKARQFIVSAPKEAPKRDLTVWTPAPQAPPKPIDSANVIAVKLPPKAFESPAPAPKRPEAKSLLTEEAPRLQPADLAATQLLANKLPPKLFTAPAVHEMRPEERNLAIADAPRIAPEAPLASAELPLGKMPPRAFAATSAARAAPAGTDLSAGIEAPPNAPDLNLAIVGLNPSDKLATLPPAPSPGAFSAGPVARPIGATSAGEGKGISVPDLFVRGSTAPAKPDLYAQAHMAPTSETTLRAALRNATPAREEDAAAAVPQNPKGATRVSSAPDPRFMGREVFMMAIQMPQLTSYSGSWLMWYASRTQRSANLAPIAPPEAHRKVDPKYIASAVSERIEGRVQLACVIDKTGRVSDVELLRGIDDRLNKSAQEALAKWEFYPATRNGVPVDVDVVVEIPFRLEPRIERR